MIVSYIDDHREKFGVEPICAVLTEHGIPIAPNTYRGHKKILVSDADLEDAHLVNALIDLWRKNKELYFTYVWTLTGFVYVSFITDVYSRRILGWRVMSSKETALVSSAVEQALATRRRHNASFTTTGLVHHSDAGSQYTSIAFTDALAEAGIAGSIGSVGDALDNALMESTIGLYKTELIEHRSDGMTWENRAVVEAATAEWVRWYNTERLHSSIDYLPPVEKEMEYATHIASHREVA